ncbi:MAG: hypothetical protein RLZ47_1742 [Bacteroidota bacterium]|jgi:hypothetical protein
MLFHLDMKRILFAFLIFGSINVVKAQIASSVNSTNGIQIGLLGGWVHHEAKISNRVVLRAELGFDSGIWGGSFYDEIGFLMTPVITAEPRLYYNLEKRAAKNKSTEGNSGNFLALKTSYHPDWFVISNMDNVEVISDISIIPTWGIKRNLSKRLNFETGLGLGYRYIFAKQAGYSANEGDVAMNLHLRFGFKL